ncbi:MAG: hypothetical protein ACPGOY_05265 [Rhodospirillaceae bacterium]
MRRIIAITSLLCLIGSGPVEATPDTVVEHDGWRIEVAQPGELAGFCQISKPVGNAIEARFLLFFDGPGGFKFTTADETVPAGIRYEMEWRVDDGPWFPAQAVTVYEKVNFTFTLSFMQLIPFLLEGQQLTIKSDKDSFSFELEGLSEALTLLLRCAQKRNVINLLNPGDPTEVIHAPGHDTGNKKRGPQYGASVQAVRLETAHHMVELFGAANIPIIFKSDDHQFISERNPRNPAIGGWAGLSMFMAIRVPSPVDKRELLRSQMYGRAESCHSVPTQELELDRKSKLPLGRVLCIKDSVGSNSQFIAVDIDEHTYLIILSTHRVKTQTDTIFILNDTDFGSRLLAASLKL